MTRRSALAELLQYLSAQHYRFVAVTPATHERVVARTEPERPTLRDIFGWSRSFALSRLEPRLADILERADALQVQDDGRIRSNVRVSSIDDLLILHSAFPTDEVNSVFFGPDTYRFWRFLQATRGRLSNVVHLVDMGAGTGAGGILASRLCGPERVTLVDINPEALELATTNAEVAGVEVETLCSDQLPGGADVVIANPPYLMDSASRAYRDGGGLLGGAVAMDWTRQALERMRPGGTLLLYTGAAFVDGRSALLRALESRCDDSGATFEVEEIDPDVFGEELASPLYEGVERIAAVGIVIGKPA